MDFTEPAAFDISRQTPILTGWIFFGEMLWIGKSTLPTQIKKNFSFGICLISWIKMWVTLNSMSKLKRVSVKIWETLGGDQGPFTVRGLRLEVTTHDSPLSSEAISGLRKHCRTFIHSPKIRQRVTHSPGTVLRILNKISKPFIF